MIRVIIADDHTLVREGTRELLERTDDIEVVGEAADGATAVDLAVQLEPDVAILDIGMPELNGVEATRRIKERCPQVGVLILTVHDEDAYVFAILEAGAAGYLLKDVHGSELVRAVRAVTSGDSILHPAITQKVLGRFRNDEGEGPRGAELTDRELQVLRLAAAGMSNKAIAEQLDVSPRTVQVHLSNVFAKLDVASRTEAVIQALKRGWIELENLP